MPDKPIVVLVSFRDQHGHSGMSIYYVTPQGQRVEVLPEEEALQKKEKPNEPQLQPSTT